ncbi:unnamed protein product [Trichobilharzia regenti]|nr:unnamed protein product [Trichobilharzia regenti]
MRLNRETVVETTRLFLVPYLATHVTKYHRWMQCSWLRESTSSELLSLDEVFTIVKFVYALFVYGRMTLFISTRIM